MKDYETMSLNNPLWIECEFVEDYLVPGYNVQYKKGDKIKVKDFGDEWFDLVAVPFECVLFPKHVLKPIK